MTALVLNIERAADVRDPLLLLLELWLAHGTHDILVAPDGGFRFGPIDEAKQEELYRKGLSKARTLRETPHGRRCAIDCWPVGFRPNRDFKSQPGMLEKFEAWCAFVDVHGKPLGIRSGRHFKGFGLFGDMPHAELADWTKRQFPSGDPILQVVPTPEPKP